MITVGKIDLYKLLHWVFANGAGDLSSIPGRVIPKTQKMVVDASLLNTQHYKVRIKGKVEQGVVPPLHLDVVAIEKGAFGLPSTMVANFTYLLTLGKIDLFKNYYCRQNRSLNIITVGKMNFYKLLHWVK